MYRTRRPAVDVCLEVDTMCIVYSCTDKSTIDVAPYSKSTIDVAPYSKSTVDVAPYSKSRYGV